MTTAAPRSRNRADIDDDPGDPDGGGHADSHEHEHRPRLGGRAIDGRRNSIGSFLSTCRRSCASASMVL